MSCTFKAYQPQVYKPTYILKEYTEDIKKFVIVRGLRQKGFEDIISRARKNTSNVKSSNSISRSRAKIFEYAICNEFDYFVTLTINKHKYDRTNLKLYYKEFSQFLRDYRKKYKVDIQYLFIPELHSDGTSWHMHGFLRGVPSEVLGINNNGYLDWFDYSQRFGYISMDKIRDKKACSMYITKYVSKNLQSCVTEYNARMYYSSRGLKEAVELSRGEVREGIEATPDFENDFVKIYWINDKVYKETKEGINE